MEAPLGRAAFAALAEQGRQALIDEGVAMDTLETLPSVDLRYAGQSYHLNVPWSDAAAAAEPTKQGADA